MATSFGHEPPALLDGRFPLPLDRPFTTQQAADVGISRHVLTHLVKEKLVRRML